MKTGYGVFKIVRSPTKGGEGRYMIYVMEEAEPDTPFPYSIALKTTTPTFDTEEEALKRVDQLYHTLPEGEAFGDRNELDE